MIDAYRGVGGVVSPTSSLTTAYDFLADAGADVYVDLVAGTTGVVPTENVLADGCRNPACLVDPGHRSPSDPLAWTADDLRDSFLGERHDIVFLAGHFSANSALAADYQTSLVTTEVAASSVDLTNTIIFSAGCHSGYNLVDGAAIPGATLALDWAQVFAQKGATLIAGTGYQYGDTDFIEYSEKLYADFAAQLRTGTGAVAIGDALVTAKRNYLAGTPDMRALDQKALLEATVFGLPMFRVDMHPEGRLSPPSSSSIITGTTPFSSGPGAPGTATVPGLDLRYADLAIRGITLTRDEVAMTQYPEETTVTATYFSGPDGTVVNPYEPVLPLISEDVGVAGQSLRGVGFRGGTYADETLVPLSGAAATEILISPKSACLRRGASWKPWVPR